MLKSAKEPPQKILQQLRQYLETCDFECVPDKSGFGFIAEKGGTDLQIVKKKKTEQRDVKEGTYSLDNIILISILDSETMIFALPRPDIKL